MRTIKLLECDKISIGKKLNKEQDPLCVKGNSSFNGRVIIKNNLSINEKVGIGVVNPQVALDINKTDAIKLPKGNISERPTATAAAHTGYVRYNSELNQFEGFGAGNVWGSLGGVFDVDFV